MRIPFIDLRAQYRALKPEIDEAVGRVLESGSFVLGEPVERFERAFAAYVGVKEAVCVSSGTAALQVALMAIGLEPGDEVIIPANTFFATAEAVLWAGGRPVLVDVREEDANIDPVAIAGAITPRTRGIVPVHLYGQMADLGPILEIAARRGLFVLEDACQAHGAASGERRAGSVGRAGAFSFYPGKNLGAYGEAGAVVTDDPEIGRRARMLRDHGQRRKYDHVVLGHNFRLEALQGAVLDVKLRHLEGWNEARRAVARTYERALAGLPVTVLPELPGRRHVRHLLVVRSAARDRLQESLGRMGIETLIHYPVPLHLQPALAFLGGREGDHPVAERLAREILSLPIHPEMAEDTVLRVADAIADFHRQAAPGGVA